MEKRCKKHVGLKKLNFDKKHLKKKLKKNRNVKKTRIIEKGRTQKKILKNTNSTTL